MTLLAVTAVQAQLTPLVLEAGTTLEVKNLPFAVTWSKAYLQGLAITDGSHVPPALSTVEVKGFIITTTGTYTPKRNPGEPSELASYSKIVIRRLVTTESGNKQKEEELSIELPSGKSGTAVLTTKTYKPGELETTSVISGKVVEGKVESVTTSTQPTKPSEPVQSKNIKIYTELATGFAFSAAVRADFFTTALIDGSGNPIVRDGKQVYRVDQKEEQQTVSTSLSGLLSFAMPVSSMSGTGRNIFKRIVPGANSAGLTFGAGLNSSTSGSFNVSPFAGMSIFFGENDSVALTLGVIWVPTQKLKGLTLGQEILTDQMSTYESYSKGTFFVGFTYRIAGSKG